MQQTEHRTEFLGALTPRNGGLWGLAGVPPCVLYVPADGYGLVWETPFYFISGVSSLVLFCVPLARCPGCGVETPSLDIQTQKGGDV